MLTDRKVFNKIKRQGEFLICINLFVGGGVRLLCDWITCKIDVPMHELDNTINYIAMNDMRS